MRDARQPGFDGVGRLGRFDSHAGTMASSADLSASRIDRVRSSTSPSSSVPSSPDERIRCLEFSVGNHLELLGRLDPDASGKPSRHPVEQRDEGSGDHAVELGAEPWPARFRGSGGSDRLGNELPKIICTTVATASAIATDTPVGTSPNAASMPGSRTRATAGSASTPRSSDVIVMPSCAPTSGTRRDNKRCTAAARAGPGRPARRSERG